MFGAFAISRLSGVSRRCFTSCIPASRSKASSPPPALRSPEGQRALEFYSNYQEVLR
jgi:hypothetical protein